MEDIKALQPRLYTFMETVINNQRLAHAYLFSGPAGAGKREMAIALAKHLFCQHEQEKPCGTCSNCVRIDHDNHPDVRWLKPDGQSIKIDQIRAIQSVYARRAQEAGWRVLIIDGADQLTPQGANSLLKFVEEPEPHTVIFFLARSREKVLPTIRSRCQELIFPSPPPERVRRQLARAHGEALASLVSHLTADLEKGEELCQAEWFAELQEIVLQLVEECLKDKVEAFFLIEQRWLKVAKEREQTDTGLDLMLLWYRDLLYLTLGMKDRIIFTHYKERLNEHAQRMSQEKIVFCMEQVLKAKRRLNAHVHPQLVLEQLVLRIKEDVHCTR
jgi:DNA polymerase-3 subunit delta'